MVLRIEGLSKIFANTDTSVTKALDEINLEIGQGEFVSIVGASGSGKSTLLRIIAGLTRPTTGQVSLNEQVISSPTKKIGMAFQHPTLFPWLSVEDNIKYGPQLNGKGREIEADIREIIRTIGLEGCEKLYPHQLSGGMAQRVSLGRAVVNHPEILLLDEPLGALDAFTRLHLQKELLEIWSKRQITMIMVTHDIDEAIFLSQKIVVMSPRPGKILEIIPIEFAQPRLRTTEAFLTYRTRVMKLLNVEDIV